MMKRAGNTSSGCDLMSVFLQKVLALCASGYYDGTILEPILYNICEAASSEWTVHRLWQGDPWFRSPRHYGEDATNED
ncbi:hypothetical protein vseg_010865 [Gypsophila vaccaria]